MLGAVVRVPAAPIPFVLPASARPLLHLRRIPPAHMASSRADDAGKPDAPPPPAPAPAPEPPEKPLPGDCCGSGCVRCVWDVYYDELDDYQKALAAHASSDPTGGKPSTDDKVKS